MAKKLMNAIEAMEAMMSPEFVERSRKKAEQEIFTIKLGQIREKRGLKQDEIKNLKELRIKTNEHLFRIAFYFDIKRNGILLTGADKKGKDEKLFYQDLIKESMKLIELYKDYNWQEEKR